MRMVLGLLVILVGASSIRAGDLEDLQGYWLSLDDPWSVEIKGNVATFHGTHAFVNAYQGKHHDVELRFSLDEEAKPRRFDLNADDLKAANERLKSKYQRSLGIYRLHGDQLTLQFAWREHLSSFDHWEGAPSNHARPFTRRLRRVAPAELALLKSLSGVWRGEILDGKQLVEIETMYVLPGWLKGLQHTPATRLQFLEPQSAAGEQPLVIHSHHTTRGNGLLGGTFTTHYWLAGIGTAKVEPKQVTADIYWLFNDKRLKHADFQTKLALDWDDLKEIREFHPPFAAQFRGPLHLKLMRIADEVTFQYGSIPNSQQYTPVPKELLDGQWQVLLKRTVRPSAVPNGPIIHVDAKHPEKERWTFSGEKCEIICDGVSLTRIWKREKERPNSLQVFAEAESERQLGWWQIQYETQTKLLRIQRSERIDDVFLTSDYVLERLPEKK